MTNLRDYLIDLCRDTKAEALESNWTDEELNQRIEDRVDALLVTIIRRLIGGDTK